MKENEGGFLMGLKVDIYRNQFLPFLGILTLKLFIILLSEKKESDSLYTILQLDHMA